jgi:hypothetical protein
VGELYLDGHAAGGEGPLDLLKGSRARDIAEAELRALLNGEPSSAKHARPPAIGITNAVVSVLRRAAASLAGR